MLKVRDGTEFASGMVSVGFWLGITLGRIVLGFITPRIGEKLAVSVSLEHISKRHEIMSDKFRSTFLLRWVWSFSSGWYRHSMFQQSQSVSKDSSWAQCFRPSLW